jgi:hypothetical protein
MLNKLVRLRDQLEIDLTADGEAVLGWCELCLNDSMWRVSRHAVLGWPSLLETRLHITFLNQAEQTAFMNRWILEK